MEKVSIVWPWPSNFHLKILLDDIKGARFWRGAKTAIEESVNNVAFIRTQIELIEHLFESNEVDEIWITFPDPQIKYKRTKHRLTNLSFLERYKNVLKPDGVINLKTDSEFMHGYTLGYYTALVTKLFMRITMCIKMKGVHRKLLLSKHFMKVSILNWEAHNIYKV